MTRISIITPSLNQSRFLERTARSILDQQGSFELEWWVIDGGSTDGTLDLLRTMDDPRLSWISEPDAGQADAVNKGLARASGDVIGWLNSDDLYLPGALTAVADCFADPDMQWAVGGCRIIDEHDREVRPAVSRYKERALRRFSRERLLRENIIPQPAVFWRSSFGSRVGPMDPSLHYTMDYDLWLRMSQLAPPVLIDAPLAAFRLHRQSKSGVFSRLQFDEQYGVACRYTSSSWVRLRHRLSVEKIVLAYRVMRLMGI